MRPWLKPLTLLLFAALSLFLLGRTHYESDSRDLVRGAQTAPECWRDGITPCPQVSHYPPLQYIPAILGHSLGLSEGLILKGFALLNGLSFILLCLWGYTLLGPSLFHRRFWIVLLLSSPLLHYSRSTMGEPLAALSTAVWIGALWLKPEQRFRLPLLFFGVLFTVLSKEVALPFIVLLSGALLWDQRHERPLKTQRPLLITLFSATILGTAIVLSWNLFRFGVPSNTFLLQEAFRVPDIETRINFALGLLLSPAVGDALFLASCACCFYLCSSMVRSPVSFRYAVDKSSDVWNLSDRIFRMVHPLWVDGLGASPASALDSCFDSCTLSLRSSTLCHTSVVTSQTPGCAWMRIECHAFDSWDSAAFRNGYASSDTGRLPKGSEYHFASNRVLSLPQTNDLAGASGSLEIL